ncbi:MULTISPECIES: ABC transporter permease [unclassified Plantactinospora]|uniref:ABC transporter permease n=1 Tax=unclassified Plantactinospora TaxID=2631981 RepID=UPI000D178BF6|nr:MULTISPECIES: ABC transporter permease [unclassified Plantactinospora]AVT28759.1 peptide ABC transporter permease [Plantactinospora sp. BC1]AVT35160.1 peptide ABC transporter permease [Plantactinospora sp. BB1]
MRYLRRKALFYLVAVWAAVTLNFLIPRLIKGNPVDAVLAKTQNMTPMSPDARRALELQFGVTDDPLWQQYLGYLGNLLRGEFGLSVSYYPTPVSKVLSQSLPWTVVMVGVATVLSVLLGITLGMLAGWRRGTWLDALVPTTTFLAAIPYFWLALVLLYLLGGILGWFPLNSGYSYETTIGFNWPFLRSAIYHAVLPAASIVLASVAGWLLGMRNMMVSTMAEDYVLTAEAKGLRPRRIMIQYAARNAVLPSVAGFAITLGFVVSGSIATEIVFSYPGVGMTLVAAVANADYPLLQGIFLVISLAVLGANFVVDLLYAVIDPRTRQAG